MFSQLIESGRRSRRPGPDGFLSLAVHVGLGVGVIWAAPQVLEVPTGPVVDTQVVFTPSEPISIPVRRHLDRGGLALTVVAPAPVPVVVTVPSDIMTGIPPVERGRSALLWAVPLPLGCAACSGAGPDSTVVFEESSVDQPVEVLDQRPPVYPRGLEAMGVTGRVVLEYVVNAEGVVEPGSVRVLEATNAAFGDSAVNAIEQSRFRPARIGRTAVKQLVRQAVGFRGRV